MVTRPPTTDSNMSTTTSATSTPTSTTATSAVCCGVSWTGTRAANSIMAPPRLSSKVKSSGPRSGWRGARGGPDVVQQGPPGVPIRSPRREELDAVGRRAPARERAGQAVVRRLHHERVQHLVRDQPGHLAPAATLGHAVQLVLGLAPAVQLQHGAVRRRRAVERDLLADRL